MCGIGTDWLENARAAQQPEASLVAAQAGDNKHALIIFVKNPQLGRVKTRMAKTMGDEAALDAYLQMLAHVRAVAASIDCHRAVYYSDFIDESDAWEGPAFSKHLQSKGDLGEKMHGAMAEMLAAGFERVVLVGSDLLDLQVQHLSLAFRALGFQDLVLGPTHDGGYCLIGMTAPHPELFLNKTWSTDTVLADTVADAKRLGLSMHLLPAIHDIDEENDWLEALNRQQLRHDRA